jgi:uncharacterized protein
MSVEEQMVLLGKLAKEDIRLIELAGVLQKGPKELGQHRKILEQKQAELTRLQEAQKVAEEAKAQCESDLATTVRRLEQAQENSKRITSMDQAEASKVEITALEKRRADNEAGLQRNLETAETRKSEIPACEQILEETTLFVDDLEQQVPRLVEEAKTEARKRLKVRERHVKKLETLVRRMYDIASTAQHGGGPLTTVIDKVCQTCHNTVPPQYLVETVQQKTIHSCTRCKKIIGKVIDTD